MMLSEGRVYLVAGCKSWHRRIFEEKLHVQPGEWRYIEKRDDLSVNFLEKLCPRYVFFLHWSWIVPEEIFKNYECVCFHMTDAPFGRGGSPLQNLIVRGHRKTMLTALRMEKTLDAGPVYLKKELLLSGTAEDIYIRAAEMSAEIALQIARERPKPQAQKGEPVNFARRKPAQSEIPKLDSLDALYDFIRMLDAEGYPKAFIEHKGLRIEFSRACRYEGKVVADATITLQQETAE